MIDRLTVINLSANAKIKPSNGEVFILKTCQRSLIIGFSHVPYFYVENNDAIKETYNGTQASIFLLETICGLQSAVLAEYEVVSQFREAFKAYLALPDRNSHILQILEKLFKDSKKVRTDFLTEIGQFTYAGIARKLIHQSGAGNKVLILGSGNLAVELIKLLKKKTQLSISARNVEKTLELSELYDLEIIPFRDNAKYEEFPLIINTIGTNEIFFDAEFFNRWHHLHIPNQLFIDLGSPSVINTILTEAEGVIRLQDIFKHSAKLNAEKSLKIENAKAAIGVLVEKRRDDFTLNYPFGWEELQFA